MDSSAVFSILIHTYMSLPEKERDDYLNEIRELLDTLAQSKYESEKDPTKKGSTK